MNETFEKLCKKHELTDHAKVEFRNLFEKEIIKVFNRKSNELILKKAETKTGSKTSSDGICSGKKADGTSCTFKAKENGYCGRHDPDKPSSTKAAAKPRVKKEYKHDCHATIAKTGKNCIQIGTIKPEGADFYYCKRHSEKWIDFEPELVDSELVSELVSETEELASELVSETEEVASESELLE